MSVLNNEEVSAYLWAYLNTYDIFPDGPSMKKFKSLTVADSNSTMSAASSLGTDFNFDLFAFDKANMYCDSLVLGCSQIYSKFK